MLARWFDFLPLFIVRRLALKHCERVKIGTETYVTARRDVLILVPKE